MSPSRVLVVEDRASLRRMLTHALVGEGYEVTAVEDASSAQDALKSENFGMVLTDLKLPIGSGIEVVQSVRTLAAGTPVVVMTAFGTVETAVEAMKLGALDFLEKPVEVDDLLKLVGSVLGTQSDASDFATGRGTVIVGSHPRMQAALRLLSRVASREATVLLRGESGTGKELFARALHELSPRAEGPFVAVNCGAIPETLIENELFGHEKGAFTGAHRRQAGRFEKAKAGTLFLDEIGDLDLGVQSKVLRVLEAREFERVGGSETLHADARVVAATHRNLEAMVKDGTFREDLFYRLDVFPIVLPPLRDRVSDIEPIAQRLIAAFAKREGRAVPTLTSEALEVLRGQTWPGNVRQLANLLERSLILLEGSSLSAKDLNSLLASTDSSSIGEVDAVQEVRDALLAGNGDKKIAAEQLGISYRTLQRRIREFDLEGFPLYRD